MMGDDSTKEALKEALKEWLDERVKDLGWWSLRTLTEERVEAGMPYVSVKSRVAHGWDLRKALTTPLNMKKVNAQRIARQAKSSS